MHQTPVVVGGGFGIGAAIVEAYRAAGAEPIVWDIGGDHDIECDVRDEGAIADALAKTIAQAGAPSELTITAGIGHAKTMLEETVEDFDRVFAINTRGPLLVMRAVAGALIEAGVPGSIVAISSVSSHIVDRGMATYCASKSALSMVIKVAAAEWGPHRIRVNGVSPGVTETRMLRGAPTDTGWLKMVGDNTALGGIGPPEGIAEAVLALHGLSWVTGQILDSDGGLGLQSPIDRFGYSLANDESWSGLK